MFYRRVYAFLLRRVLGPYLTPEACAKLHSSIEVAVSEGRYVLRDVELRADRITDLLERDGLAVRRATVRRLSVVLSLHDRENGDAGSRVEDTAVATVTSTAGVALTLSRTARLGSAGCGVSLVAQIELEGLEVDFGPVSPTVSVPASESSISLTPPSELRSDRAPAGGGIAGGGGGMIASYIDAALKSLKLSVELRDMRIRFLSGDRKEGDELPWVGASLKWARYHDISAPLRGWSEGGQGSSISEVTTPISSSAPLLRKEVEFNGLLFEVGGGQIENACTVARMEGGGGLKILAHVVTVSPADSRSEPHLGEQDSLTRIRNDIDFCLGERFDVSFDLDTLKHVFIFMETIKKPRVVLSKCSSHDDANLLSSKAPESATYFDDAEDAKALSEMMRQYAEARHYARTQQLRGGLLLPSISFDGTNGDQEECGVVTFDTFFDANDESFMAYKSVMEDSIMSEGQYEKDNFIHTKVSFELFEVTMKLALDSASEHVLLSVRDIKAHASKSAAEASIGLAIAGVKVENSVHAKGEHFADIGNIVRFVEDRETHIAADEGAVDNGFVIFSSPCLSLNVLQNYGIDGDIDISAEASLHAIELTYHHSVSKITTLLRSLSDEIVEKEHSCGTTSAAKRVTNANPDPSRSLKTVINLPSVTILLPLASMLESEEGEIFKSGQSSTNFTGCEKPAIGLMLSDIIIETSMHSVAQDSDAREEKKGDSLYDVKTVSLSCQNSLLFYSFLQIGNVIEGGSRVIDVVAFSSESIIDSDAIIRFQYFTTAKRSGSGGNDIKRAGRKSSFPLVSPLSAVKARQQFESHEVDEIYKPNESSRFDAGRNRAEKSSDQQYTMASEANSCQSDVEISIPLLAVNVSQSDIIFLSRALISLNHKRDTDVDAVNAVDDKAPAETVNSRQGHLGIAISCNQASIGFLGDCDENPSYLVILDQLQMHLLQSSTGCLRHSRFLLDDATLYEARGGLCSLPPVMISNSSQIFERCNNIRRRSSRVSRTRATPIFFRSKLSLPLSPDTPAFIIDVINRSFTDGDFDDEDDGHEREVHISVYDMTFRCDPSFNPMNLADVMSLLQYGDKDGVTSTNKPEDHEEQELSITNLFVTFSDCAMDYTPPSDFNRASRTLIRVSEVRGSSNLVSPPGAFQAYKMSVADVSVHLANSRVPYNAENSRLSCASSLLHQSDLSVNYKQDGTIPINSSIPIDSTLRRMAFVTIATLDSVDALVVVASKSYFTQRPSVVNQISQRADTTATLSLGQISLYACQDSFSCFTDTISELVLRITTPSTDEIRELRKSLDCAGHQVKSFGKSSGEICALDSRSKAISTSDIEENKEETEIVGEKSIFGTTVTNNVFSREKKCTDETKKQDLSDPFEEMVMADNLGQQNQSKANISFSEDEDDDWLAVDYEWSRDTTIPGGEEQQAKWLVNPNQTSSSSKGVAFQKENPSKILHQHIPIQSFSDPLAKGDMNAKKFAGTNSSPHVNARIVVKDMSLNLRFFAGFDWPKTQENKLARDAALQFAKTISEAQAISNKGDKKSKLLSELLDEDGNKNYDNKSLRDDKKEITKQVQLPSPLLHNKVKPRQTHRFFQFTGEKLRMRIDSFNECSEHRLASCVDLVVSDLFLAETISGDKPVKILGEWLNESEHPRDTNDGLLMMKIVSTRPVNRFSADGKFISDESMVLMELLPLRFFVYQTALRFIRDFFAGSDGGEEAIDGDDDDEDDKDQSPKKPYVETTDDVVSPTFFHSFKMRPCKLKIDYRPEGVDTTALKDGSYVELVNLLPLEEMLLTLNPVEIKSISGWGTAFGDVARRWMEDVCATQLHKFLTKSRPFQPFTSVGAGVADLVMIPLEEYRMDGGSIIRGIRAGTSAFAGTVAYEALNTSAKVTRFAANRLSGATSQFSSDNRSSSDIVVSLPSRPDEVPSNFVDVAEHALDSVTAGLREANYKIIFIPYKEYKKSGTPGAVKSAIRGIPVAVRAPLSGASEALSYTLLGARNQLRPDLMAEEKATMRGLSREF